MQTQTSLQSHPTVRPPEVSAALISLEDILEDVNKLAEDVKVVTGFISYDEDFQSIRVSLEHVQGLLTSCRRLVDPDRLRRVVINSLRAQS